MQVTIRPMNESDDIEKITDWFESIGPEWLLDYESVPAQREQAREQLLTWMRGEGGRSCVLVAEDPGSKALAGFATCLLQTDPVTKRSYGTIHGIYVDEPQRGKGIGRTLKDAADEWCRTAGAAYMRAYIGIGNEAMLRVCKLLGYEPWMVTWVRRFD
ncbi:MAG: GNAT family N-acetyltransferase [Planctomycetes bacterium]|nr:GNAT family N-acetyltransferase [Planctomycetota bacterium]